MTTTKDDSRFTSILARLRGAALAYPEAVEEFPWGDRVAKVRGKIFVFLNTHEGKLHVTAKLPQSGDAALMLPFAEPTGYNLGKSGWVTARFGPKDPVPEAMLVEWIEESYRAVAPKRLAEQMGSGVGEEKAAVPAKKAVAKKAAVPAKKAAVPAKKAGTPAKKASVPAKKAAVPAKKASVPAKKALVPAKKAAASTKKASVPAKKASVLAKKASVPAKKAARAR